MDAVQLFNLDSTNVGPAQWQSIVACIRENYSAYDGFVIAHGTDTMAYTAAALSYMVQNSAMPKMNQASGAYYVYPEYQEYLRKADIISIQIGSNDALVPCIVGLGEATNWKSEQLAALMVSGALRDFNFQKLGLFLEALNRMTLTFDESRATNRLLFRGMDEICDQAYTNVTASLPQIVAGIRALNPDAKIVLLLSLIHI